MRTIKLKVQNILDRERMVTALANSEFKVWVKHEHKHGSVEDEHFVCFEVHKECVDDNA